MNPFVSVRVAVSAGYSLRCYFPGYQTPQNGGGGQISVNFYWNPNHFFKTYPSQLLANYQYLSVTYPLNNIGPYQWTVYAN
jgi:hypothetical protein